MMRRLIALLAVLSLAGCTTPAPHSATNNMRSITPPPKSSQRADNIAAKPGPPLPAGSRFEKAGTVQPKPIDTVDVEGSLRPDDEKPRKRVPEILKRGRLIVGVDQSHNLLSYRDSGTGELRGFEVDLAHEIARDIFGDPTKVDFRYIESSERVTALETGAVDIVIRTMTITAERQHQVAFSIPYLETHTRLLVMKNSGITSVDQTRGRTICASDGSTAVDRVRTDAPSANILITRSWGDCLMALQLNEVDAVMTDDTLLSGMLDQDPYTEIVGEDLGNEVYGVGIRRPDRHFDSTGLTRQVNSTIERIKQDGTWHEMYNEWFGAYLPGAVPPPSHYREEDK